MAHTQYGIGVTKNRFELFDNDEEDPLEVLKVREQEKEARKKTKLSEKENKGKEPAPKGKQPVVRKGIKETQNLKSQEAHKVKEDPAKAKFPNRLDRPDRRFNGEERNNRRNRDERPPEVHREERNYERRDYRGGEGRGFYSGDGVDMRGGRGRGGGSSRGGGNMNRGGIRGGRAQRPAFDNRGKREYERQSGSDKTGVKPVDKREGSGAHNWGTHRDDLEDIQSGGRPSSDDNGQWTMDNKVEEPFADSNNVPADGEEGAVTGEDEPRELTLDEWKAMRGPRQKPVYNLRKAGEGEDLSQWKKMYALQKKKEGEDEDDDEEDEYESCEYPQRVGRQKHILDIDIHFKDARGRGRGGSRGRGGPRLGGGGAGRPNAPQLEKPADEDARPRKSAPKVDDEHDFPSLG